MPKQFTADEVKAKRVADGHQERRCAQVLAASRAAIRRTGRAASRSTKSTPSRLPADFVDLIQWRAHRSHAVAWPTTAMCSNFAIRMRARTCSRAMPTARHISQSLCGTRRKSATNRSPPPNCARAITSSFARHNAVPFDPNAGWKEGDLIPDYVDQPRRTRKVRPLTTTRSQLEGRHVDSCHDPSARS